MALPAFGAIETWQDAIEKVHGSHFRKATISVFDGRTTILAGRPARVQQQRSPAVATDSGQHIAKRAFLFEIELRAGDPVIKKGMLVRVTNGGRDPQLENYGFTVTNSVNSSEAAVRTIETITELDVLPKVTP